MEHTSVGVNKSDWESDLVMMSHSHTQTHTESDRVSQQPIRHVELLIIESYSKHTHVEVTSQCVFMLNMI